MNRLMVVLVLVVSTRAADADKARAQSLMQEADKLLKDAGCLDAQKEGCADPAGFPAGVTRYDQAIRLDPSPATALRACTTFTRLQRKEQERALADGTLYRFMTWCNYARRHPDSDTATRDAAGGGDYRRWPQYLRTEAERDARVEGALRALFGVGLVVKHDKATNKVTIEAGTLDAKLLQEYIAEFWGLYVGKLEGGGTSHIRQDLDSEYEKLRGKGLSGWALLEPGEKYRVCTILTRTMSSAKGSATLEFCKVQTLIELNAPRFAFRGTTASYDAAGEPGVRRDDRVFMPSIDGKYEPVITVAAPLTIDSFTTWRLQRNTSIAMFGQTIKNPEVKALLARSEKAAKQKEAAFKVAEKKIAGRGGVIVFGDGDFTSWAMPKLLKKGDTVDCNKLHFKAYAPASGGEHEVELAVDNKVCSTQPLGSFDSDAPDSDSLAHPENTRAYDGCATLLTVAGNHEVTIGMFKVNAARTGRREVTSDLKIRDEYQGVRGKGLTRATTKCTTP